MADNPVVALTYDPLKAAFYGELVNAAYTMYDDDPTNPTPSPPKPPAQLPGNYKFVAWVQMQDFFISQSPYTFYGLIAQNPSGANDYVLAIRGTSDPEEWWDDFVSMNLVQMTGFGPSTGYANVGYGFYRIYQTLRVIYPPKPSAAAPGALAAAPPESLEAVGSFADQVAEAVHRHAAETAPPRAQAEAAAAKKSVTVAAHSLGSALATLYVADNSIKKSVETPLLCTLASPRVGDWTFKTTFDNLGIPSWRIVNEPDVVPRVPFFGFWHIDTEHEYDSGLSTIPSLECWHSIYTYLHLLDPTQPLSSSCTWSMAKTAAAAMPAAAAAAAAAAAVPSRAALRPSLRAPALPPPSEKEIAVTAPAGTTINITIKVG